MFVDGKEFSADNPEAIQKLSRLFEQNKKKKKNGSCADQTSNTATKTTSKGSKA